jgi:hypothetical protein
MPSLRDLQERRVHECRLTADRALRSLDDAVEFLRERGLITRTPDCALPSLFAACHQEEYAPGKGGFGAWPRTAYIWSFQLPGLAPKIHRGKTLYLSAETAGLADPVCRAELARLEAAGGEPARVLAHLRAAGPSLLEDVQAELGLSPASLRSLRKPLEQAGAVVARSVVFEPHRHTSELARWDQVQAAAPDGGPGPLLVAGVRAAVLAPEHELGSWFSWPLPAGLVDSLVEEGRLERLDGFVWAP